MKKLQLEKLQNDLSNKKAKERKNESLKESISNINYAWRTMTFNEKRNVIKEVIDKIVVNGNNIKIYYNV